MAQMASSRHLGLCLIEYRAKGVWTGHLAAKESRWRRHAIEEPLDVGIPT